MKVYTLLYVPAGEAPGVHVYATPEAAKQAAVDDLIRDLLDAELEDEEAQLLELLQNEGVSLSGRWFAVQDYLWNACTEAVELQAHDVSGAYNLSSDEVRTTLFALREYQERYDSYDDAELSNTLGLIDALCERLNVGE